MKYKVGDKVKTVEGMIFTISEIHKMFEHSFGYRVKEDRNIFLREFNIECLIPEFERGELIEVSGDRCKWNKLKFYRYDSELPFPYICHVDLDKFISWKHARKIQKHNCIDDVIVEKDGKKYKLVEVE